MLSVACIAAAFLGGDNATSAMSTALFSKQQKWTRWYNTPGCFEIQRQYGLLAKHDAEAQGHGAKLGFLAVVGGEPGPEYTALYSGTKIKTTSHIAHLLEKDCNEMEATMKLTGRKTAAAPVTVITLGEPAPCHLDITLETPTEFPICIPIIFSMCVIAACFVVKDYNIASAIIIGVFANGLSGHIISSITLTFTRPNAAESSPPGDGLLLSQNGVIILKGKEASVNGITRGHLELSFGGKVGPISPMPFVNIERPALYFGTCSLLFTMQFLVQAALIIQGTMVGKAVFLVSLVAAWLYNVHLASIEKEQSRRKLLMEQVIKTHGTSKYVCGTRTSMAVFTALTLGLRDDAKYVKKILTKMIPNKTKVWTCWKHKIADKIAGGQKLHFTEDELEREMHDDEQHLLRTLLLDAKSAYENYDYVKNRLTPTPETRSDKNVHENPIQTTKDLDITHEDSDVDDDRKDSDVEAHKKVVELCKENDELCKENDELRKENDELRNQLQRPRDEAEKVWGKTPAASTRSSHRRNSKQTPKPSTPANNDIVLS